MSIVHIVLFEFKPSTESVVVQDVSSSSLAGYARGWVNSVCIQQRSLGRGNGLGKILIDWKQVCKRMLSLRHQCIHPTTKQPYILDSSGGRDNSPEGHQVVETPVLTIPLTTYTFILPHNTAQNARIRGIGWLSSAGKGRLLTRFRFSLRQRRR